MNDLFMQWLTCKQERNDTFKNLTIPCSLDKETQGVYKRISSENSICENLINLSRWKKETQAAHLKMEKNE